MKKILITLLIIAMNLPVLASVSSAASIDSEVGKIQETVMINSDFSDMNGDFSNLPTNNITGNPKPQFYSDTVSLVVYQQPIHNGDTTLVANAILKQTGNMDIRLSAGGDNTYKTYWQVNSENIAGNDTKKIKMWSTGNADRAKGVTGFYIKASNGVCAASAVYSFEADVYAPQARTLRYVISRNQGFQNTWQMYTEPGGYVLPDAITEWKKLRIDLDVANKRVSTYLDNELQGQPAYYKSQEPGWPAGYFGIMSINNGTIYIDNARFTKIDRSIKLSLNKLNMTEVKNSPLNSTLSITGTNTSGSSFDIYTILGAYDITNQLIGIYQAKKTISTNGSVADGSIPIFGDNGISYISNNDINNVATLKMFVSDSLEYLYPNIYAISVKDNTISPVFYDLNKNVTEHEWYAGNGFAPISGGQTDTVTYNATEAGEYELRVRYANGDSSAKTLSLYVNDQDQKQLSFDSTKSAWNTWSDVVTTVTLRKGDNSIFLKKDDGDTAGLNVDTICIKPVTSVN